MEDGNNSHYDSVQKFYDSQTENLMLKSKLKKNYLDSECSKKAHFQGVEIGRTNPTIELFRHEKKEFPYLRSTHFGNLPADLLQKLTEYLSDDELFEVRSLNRYFYAAFYNQRVVSLKSRKFNYRRAIQLANMGRVFKNLEYFRWAYNTSPRSSKLNPWRFKSSNFPKLRFLYVGKQLCFWPRMPNIRTVRYDHFDGLCTSKLFPNLEELIYASAV